jgi:hypothetical protein
VDGPVGRSPSPVECVDALTLFDELGADDWKEYTEVAGGDHFLFHGPRRRALYDVVYRFQQRC